MLAADAVVIVASEAGGRGMFVELGAALSRAEHGKVYHLVLIGAAHDDSVFFYHPAEQHVATVRDWLATTNSERLG